MNIKEKILALSLYAPSKHPAISGRGRLYDVEDMRKHCAEVAQAEMDALIAELKTMPRYCLQSVTALEAILDKWSTK